MREDRGGDGRSQRAVECPWLVRRDGTSVLFGGAWGLDGFGLCAKGYWFGVQGRGLSGLGFRIQLRRFKGFSLYIYRELLREFSTEVMTIEEVALSQPRSTPLSLSWCYTELGGLAVCG